MSQQLTGRRAFSTAPSYDARGNLTPGGASAYLYDAENRLVQQWARTSSTRPNGSAGYTGTLKADLVYDRSAA